MASACGMDVEIVMDREWWKTNIRVVDPRGVGKRR